MKCVEGASIKWTKADLLKILFSQTFSYIKSVELSIEKIPKLPQLLKFQKSYSALKRFWKAPRVITILFDTLPITFIFELVKRSKQFTKSIPNFPHYNKSRYYFDLSF